MSVPQARRGDLAASGAPSGSRRSEATGHGLLLAAAPGCIADSGDGAEDEIEEVGTDSEALPPSLTVNGYGWAWVQASGAVGGAYFYNSSGGTVVGAQLATGQYRVDFNGINDAGSAQVVAYGGNAHCKLFTTPVVSGTKVSAYVTCYTPAGSFTNVVDHPLVLAGALLNQVGHSSPGERSDARRRSACIPP